MIVPLTFFLKLHCGNAKSGGIGLHIPSSQQLSPSFSWRALPFLWICLAIFLVVISLSVRSERFFALFAWERIIMPFGSEEVMTSTVLR